MTGGLLPARTIGFAQVNSAGFAVDAWQNPLRYAVARLNTNCATSPPANTRLFTHKGNLRTYGMSCQPNDLLVCKSATGISSTGCGGTANSVMTASLVVAIVFSTGKNGANGAAGPDEATNLKTNAALTPMINQMFISHTPSDRNAANGEFDDQLVWITVGELYSKLIAAGVLP